MKKIILLLLFIACSLCRAETGRFRPSIEVFFDHYTGLLKGKRVGLITNPTGVDAGLEATVDRFRRDPRINLTALFAPEHGIRGNVAAGQHIPGGKDPASGIPVYSLYGGRDHRPTREQLARVDILVYHIQDIGCRTYTYIWHLAECMSAAGEAGIPVMIFDVPNPLGLGAADGPIREERFKSFIGLYPIPYTYALTVGELARYLKGEEKINCKTYIVPMQNYRRRTSWRDTGLPWVPTSPQIPSPEAAMAYHVTGPLGTLSTVNIGINHTLPFQVIGAPYLKAPHMADTLNRAGLPGLRFRPVYYTPTAGLYRNQAIQGVQLHFTDPAAVKPVLTTVTILCYLRDNCPQFRWPAATGSAEGFDKAMGTDRIRKMIQAGRSAREIADTYRRQLQDFERRAAKYRIYR